MTSPDLPPEWLEMVRSWVVGSMARPTIASVPPGQQMYVIGVVGRSMRARGAILPDGWDRALSVLCGWGDPVEPAQQVIGAETLAEGEPHEPDVDV